MSFNIKVKSDKTVKLPTAGKYCDRDILVTASGGGYTEADLQEKYDEGAQAEYERFWDALQEDGKDLTDYRYKFFYWPNEAYTPKYPIRSTKTSMMGVFQNARIVNTLVDVDFSGTTTCSQAFGYCTFLHTIPKLIVGEKNTFSGAFQSCNSLVNVIVEGKFGSPVDFQWSTMLSCSSIESIVNALSATISGLSLTLSKTAVNMAFETSAGVNDGSTSEEWTTLANTKSNWTINLV